MRLKNSRTPRRSGSLAFARQVAPSVISDSELTSSGTAVSAPPVGGNKKLFSEVVCGRNELQHKLTVKPNDDQLTEEIKNLLKPKFDPLNMKIGIRTFKSLRMTMPWLKQIASTRLRY